MFKRIALTYLLMFFVAFLLFSNNSSTASLDERHDYKKSVDLASDQKPPHPLGDLAFAVFGLVAGQAPEPPDCPNAEKPWMCGDTEHACSRDGHKAEGDDTVYWHACSCKHTCKEGGRPNDETQGRGWDGTCKARCKPSHCHCGPKHCGET